MFEQKKRAKKMRCFSPFLNFAALTSVLFVVEEVDVIVSTSKNKKNKSDFCKGVLSTHAALKRK